MTLTMCLLALFHTCRGRGLIRRWLFFPLIGVVAFILSSDWLFSLIWAAGCAFYQWWPMNFACITGRAADLNSAKIPALSNLVTGLLLKTGNFSYSRSGVILWGTLWQAGRGMFLAPTFLVLAVAYLKPEIVLYALLLPIHGLLYRLGAYPREEGAVERAEVYVGLLFGLLMSLTWGSL